MFPLLQLLWRGEAGTAEHRTAQSDTDAYALPISRYVHGTVPALKPGTFGFLARLSRRVKKARQDDEVGMAQTAVTIRREIAQSNPEKLPELAASLHQLAYRLGRALRVAEALTPMLEAVAIRRRLADSDPDRFLPLLATSLHDQSVLLAAASRRAEALAPMQESVAIRRRLAKA